MYLEGNSRCVSAGLTLRIRLGSGADIWLCAEQVQATQEGVEAWRVESLVESI